MLSAGFHVHEESIAVAYAPDVRGAEVVTRGKIGTRQCDMDKLTRKLTSRARPAHVGSRPGGRGSEEVGKQSNQGHTGAGGRKSAGAFFWRSLSADSAHGHADSGEEGHLASGPRDRTENEMVMRLPSASSMRFSVTNNRPP